MNNKILLISKRELLTRVRKKSFLVMSFVVPVMVTLMFLLINWASKADDEQIQHIAVLDQTPIFKNIIPETNLIKFTYISDSSLVEAKKKFASSQFDAILFIPENFLKSKLIQLHSDKRVKMSTEIYVRSQVEKIMMDIGLLKSQVAPEVLRGSKFAINVQQVVFNKSGKNRVGTEMQAMSVGMFTGTFMYFFIFMFGVQVMRGTMEEKNNRIVELIVSSVKPFQLMMGKIIGIGVTGLLQFILQISITVGLLYVAKTTMFPEMTLSPTEQLTRDLFSGQDLQMDMPMNQIPGSTSLKDIFVFLQGINIGFILLAFAIFFMGGYMLYSSLFAAVGSAVDQDTDTQQFVLPVTLPLLFSVFLLIIFSLNPDHPVNVFFSMFPFTSPIIMMGRIPFGVPVWQVITAIVLLIGTFVLTTWFAGRVYRTGILMYGKKITYKELIKWLKY